MLHYKNNVYRKCSAHNISDIYIWNHICEQIGIALRDTQIENHYRSLSCTVEVYSD